MNRFFEFKEEGLTREDFLQADRNIDLSNLDIDARIKSVSTLEHAKAGDLSFFTITLVSGDKYNHALEHTKASYCLLKRQYANVNPNVLAIISDEPYITFIRLCDRLFVAKRFDRTEQIADSAKISATAVVGKGVKIGSNVIIDDFVRIEDGVEIGDGSVIKSGARIGYNCVIGKNCIIGENTSIKFTEMGDDCILQSGVALGQDGFGYTFDARTKHNEKIYHFGYVKIGDRVEIGANSCVDRGVFEATEISNDVKIDNLVQIAHNVKIGAGTMMASQTGIAGSAVIGEYCMLGGKCGVAGHITLGDKCIMYGSTNISKSFPKHSKIIGTPGEFYHIWAKNYSLMRHFMKKKRRQIKKQNGFRRLLTYMYKLFGIK